MALSKVASLGTLLLCSSMLAPAESQDQTNTYHIPLQRQERAKGILKEARESGKKLWDPPSLSNKGLTPLSEPIPSLRGAKLSIPGLRWKEEVQAQADASNGTILLHNFLNTEYSGEVFLGSNRQPFRVIFDTGSSNTWVPGVNCGESCDGKAKFNPDQSETFVGSSTPFHVRYGSGTVEGFFAKDTVEMAGYKATNQIFAQVTDTSGLGHAYSIGKFDGLVGMGFKELSEGNVETPMGNLLAQGAIDQGVFVFYLGLDSPGMITIGAMDESRIVPETFAWTPLKDASYWAVASGPVKVTDENKNVLGSFNNATTTIIDSGTSLILGPDSDIRGIADAVGATYSPFDGLYLLSCKTKMPNLTWTIGGKEYTLAPEDYVIQDDQDTCVLGLMPVGFRVWVLGDIFMRKYVAVFDVTNTRVGLGLAKTGDKLTENNPADGAAAALPPKAAAIDPVPPVPSAEAAPPAPPADAQQP